MAARSHIAQKAYDIILSVVNQLGYDLVDVEYKKEGKAFFLRIFIDRKGGISTDDCEIVSKTVDPLLDSSLGVIPDFLEVSSPGLTRPLTSTADFLRHYGEEVEVTLYHALDATKHVTGIISEANDDFLTILSGEEAKAIPREAIASVKRTIHF